MEINSIIQDQEIIELYDNQIPVIEKLMEFVEANAHKPIATGFVVMPGGSGKTVVFSHFVERLNGRAIILSPTLTVLDQNVATMRLMNPEIKITVYNSEERDLSGDVVYMTYHSLVSLLKQEAIARDFAKVIIFDEGHKSLSEKRSQIPDKLDALCIAFTATDKYSEQRNVEKIFKTEIYRMSLKEAIELGILIPLRGFVIETNIDLRGVKLTSRNQLDEQVAERHLNVLARNKIARDFYLEKFKGVPAVAFCVSVSHAIFLAQYFNEAGIRSAAVHGGTTKDERNEIYKKFHAGELDILCSRDVLTEGWNSQRVVICFNLRPTYSWVLAEQRASRVTRPFEGKTFGIVVEFQDIYGKKDQPILIYHLFGKRTFTQGGYVYASPHLVKIEKQALENNIDVNILNNLQVSSVVREVVNLNPLISDARFEDKGLVKDILLSRADVDYTDLTKTNFLNLEFDHIAFKGNGRKLIMKCLGLLWGETKEDYELFIADVLGEHLLYKFLNFDDLETGNEIEEAVDYDSPAADAVLMKESLNQEIERCLLTLTEREREIVYLWFGFPAPILRLENSYRTSIELIRKRALITERELTEREVLDIEEYERKLNQISECRANGEGLSGEEIGELYNLKRERIRQIKDKALQRLRHTSRSKFLAEYVDYIEGWHDMLARRRALLLQYQS
jgi:RNA polymerase sigma factor (sigma-70 family)